MSQVFFVVWFGVCVKNMSSQGKDDSVHMVVARKQKPWPR